MTSDRLSATFAALADPTRRAILARLAQGDATVSELAEPFDMSLQAVSKHLKVLQRAGLVTRQKDGQLRPARIYGPPLRDAAAWLDDYSEFFESSFDRLAQNLKKMEAKRVKRPAKRAKKPPAKPRRGQ